MPGNGCVTTLGKLFTLCPCHQAALIGTGKSCGANRHTTQCTSLTTQHNLMSGWWLQKWRLVLPYVSMRFGKECIFSHEICNVMATPILYIKPEALWFSISVVYVHASVCVCVCVCAHVRAHARARMLRWRHSPIDLPSTSTLCLRKKTTLTWHAITVTFVNRFR